MSTVTEAKTWLESISPGEWYAYTHDYNTKDYKQMIKDVETSLKKGDPYRISGVAIHDEPRQICTTGNGLKSQKHAQFIATAPRIIRELMIKINTIEVLLRESRRQAAKSGERNINLAKKLDESYEKLKDLENDVKYLTSVRNSQRTKINVEYVWVDAKKYDGLLDKIAEYENTQNLFPMETDHKVVSQDGVEYVFLKRDLYSEELKNAAVENVRRTIRQINKRHNKELTELETEYNELIEKNEVLKSDIEIWRKSLFEANERIKELEDTE